MTTPVPGVDLRPDHWAIVRKALRRHVPDREVLAFGSRATWTAKDYSDLDLAVMGEESLSLRTASALDEAFGDSDLPFKVDVVDWARIDDGFRDIIRRYGVSVQTPTATSSTARPAPLSPLADIIDLILSSVDKKTKPGERPVRLCNYMDVYNNTFITDHLDFLAATATDREVARCGLTRGDVIITKDSEKHDDIGVPALVRHDIANLVCGYHLAILRPRPAQVLGDYLVYALKAPPAQHQFHAYANGVTRFGLRKGDIGLVEVPLPPLSEQGAIARTLRTLDDKIELNHRMNETLEAMARALFKAWFVDFDPVRAKMEGRDTGLPRDIADLFPDRLLGSELGKIPEGWEVSKIGDEVDAVGGSTPITKEPSFWHQGDHYWATPKDLSKLSSPVLLDTHRKITDAGLRKISSRTLPVGTVLLSSRAPIGYLAIAEVPTAVNQGFIAMRCERRLPNLYVLYWCEQNLRYIRDIAGGSTFAEISKKTFRTVSVIVPSKALLVMYQHLSQSLYDLVVANVRESAALATLRDTLLPKLISGELRISRSASNREGSNLG